MGIQPSKRLENVTILLVEDEEMIADTTTTLLEWMGCLVLKAKSGAEAVEIAQTYDGKIDLAMLDIMLPDMDGTEIYPMLVKSRPAHKVIVCSGYNVDGPAQAILDAGADGFLPKPYTLKSLIEILEETLR